MKRQTLPTIDGLSVRHPSHQGRPRLPDTRPAYASSRRAAVLPARANYALGLDGISGVQSIRRPAPKLSADLQPGKVMQDNYPTPPPQSHSYSPDIKVSSGKPARRSRRKKLRSVVLKSSFGLVLTIVLTGSFLFGKGYFQLRQVFNGGGPEKVVALSANASLDQLKGEGDGRVNILLLGIGGAGHDGPDLTDTILLVSIDPVNNKAAMISVPRDLWIKQPVNYVGAYQKINAAYEAGKYAKLGKEDESNDNQAAVEAGFKSVDTAVSTVFGIPIDYNMLVDFQAFKQGVDAVGGVTVNVPTELYDPTMAWENHWDPVLAKPGNQTMNGKQALLYVRSRETSSDFARTQRQRAVMLALKSKILTVGTLSDPLKISQLMSAFGDNVRTDMSLSDAEAVYNLFRKINDTDIQSVGLADPPNNYVTTGSMNGISIVRPTAGQYDYSQIQAYVRTTLRDGYLAKENAPILVVNETTVAGVATREADVLKSYGYNVNEIADTPAASDAPTTQIVDLSKGADKYTLNYLQQRFKTKASTTLADPSIQPGNAKFVILVGNDEAISH